MRISPLRRYATLLALAILGTLVGCGGGGGGQTENDPELFFVNASADAGQLRFFLDDTAFSDTLAYLGRSKDFKSFEFRSEIDGGYDVSLQTPDGSEVFENIVRTFDVDRSYVAVAYGVRDFAVGDEEKRLSQVIITFDRSRPVGNQAQLVVLHSFNRGVGNDTPQVRFQSPGDNPQFQTDDITYGNFQAIQVDSGTSSWVVKRSDGEAIYATATAKLDPASIYLVVISGVEGATVAAQRPRVTFIKVPAED